LPASEQTGAMAVDAVQLVLTDEETAAGDAIEADHYPLSPRVQTRRAILNKIRPEPPREPRPWKPSRYGVRCSPASILGAGSSTGGVSRYEPCP
jgi:hypothetical protein